MPLSIAPTSAPTPAPGPHFTIIAPTPVPAPTPVVNIITENPSGWDSLWPLVVAAGLALAAAVAVQLFVVPLADSRKRREQRWEDDVQTLGELLIFAHAKVFDPFWHELIGVAALASVKDADPQRLATAMKENRDNLRVASTKFDEVESQVRWLADRVMSLAPKGRSTSKLRGLIMRYQVAHIGLHGLMPHLRIDGSAPSDQEVMDGGEKMRKATKVLADEIASIANAGSSQFRRRGSFFKKVGKLLLSVRTRLKASFAL